MATNEIECGIYGGDTLVAERRPDGVVELAVVGQDGNRRQWTIDATSTLTVLAQAWGSGAMLGVDTRLQVDGQEITHFEFDFVSGGTHDGDVAKFVVPIAAHTKCGLDIQPLRIAGNEHLASIRCENQEQLHAIKNERGAVRVDNAMTGATWNIVASDTLVVAGNRLERNTAPIATFACAEEEVVAFARRVADAAGATFVSATTK